ncbi:Ubiquitin-specific protease, partial [Globisporangium splendens]
MALSNDEQPSTDATCFLISTAAFQFIMTAKNRVGVIQNQALVDEANSCEQCGFVVLKHGLIQGEDYHLVEEPLWRTLAHSIGCDWEIPRSLSYWNHDGHQPKCFRCRCKSRHKLRVLVPRTNEFLRLDALKLYYLNVLREHELLAFPRLYSSDHVSQLELWYRPAVETGTSWEQMAALEEWTKHRPQFLCLVEPWRDELKEGELVDARDTCKLWYEARVLRASAKRVLIHYCGWSSRYDEWVERKSPRLAPLYTKVKQWRKLRPSDKVEVAVQVPNKRTVWRDSVVVEVHDVKRVGRKRERWACISVGDKFLWMSAQDQKLCAAGTHGRQKKKKKAREK